MENPTPTEVPSENQTPLFASRRRRRWPVLLVIGFFAVVILGGIGFVTASALEEHDTFCISCHTVPEVTYYNRAYISLDNPANDAPDLATAHYLLSQQHNKPAFACINCHRGDSSLSQRISTLALGGRDALIYIAGRENSTIEKTQIAEGWLPNSSCVSCHSDTLLKLEGLDNHFHTHLPQAAGALASGGKLTVPDQYKGRQDLLLKAGLDTVSVNLECTSCHQAHKSITNGVNNFFVDADTRNKACVTCHQTAKKGPQELSELQ